MKKRFFPALLLALVVAFVVFWIGAKLANVVSGPHTELNEFTVGQKMMLCGRVVDTRHELGLCQADCAALLDSSGGL